jgi:hypothetical protein
MTTVESVQDEKNTNLLSILPGMIDKPKVSFQAIMSWRSAWAWITPLLIVLVCMAVMMVVQAPYTAEMAKQQMEERLLSMSPSEAEAVRAQMETFSSQPVMLATSLGGAIVMLLGGLALQAAILYFGSIILGGETLFGSMFKVSVWSRLPYAVSYLALAVYMLVARQMVQYPGLSALVASGDLTEDSANPLVSLLGVTDLFWLWHLWLVLVGVGVVARFTRGKSMVLTILYAILMLALTVLPSLLFGGMGG